MQVTPNTDVNVELQIDNGDKNHNKYSVIVQNQLCIRSKCWGDEIEGDVIYEIEDFPITAPGNGTNYVVKGDSKFISIRPKCSEVSPKVK